MSVDPPNQITTADLRARRLVWRAFMITIDADPERIDLLPEHPHEPFEVVLTIDGVPFDFRPFLHRLMANHQRLTEEVAGELIRERLGRSMEDIDRKVRETFNLPDREND
jgi:hypothetical protein